VEYARRATYAQHVKLGFVKRHIAQCQAGKDARENNKDGHENSADDESGIMFSMFTFGELVSTLGDR
jgi:hypothetical protein